MTDKQDKYGLFWRMGTLLSFILYFSGAVWLYLFLRRRVGRKARKIILTFHRIADCSQNPEVSVSPNNFRRQMEYLSRKFNVASLADMLQDLDRDSRCPQDSLAITFDDGYKDNFTQALPILNEYNFPATIFLVSDLIGRPQMLRAEEIKLMQKRTVSFGSHSLSHAVLSKAGATRAKQEIADSKRRLEEVLGEKINFFAYPKGKKRDFNQEIETLVKKAGYQAAFTTENGALTSANDLFALPRIGIRDCPLFVFKVRVSGIFESKIFYALRKIVGWL